MATFKYRSKGTANENWNEDTIEADSVSDAEDKLDKIYGIERDDNGNQTNSDLIQVEIINEGV